MPEDNKNKPQEDKFINDYPKWIAAVVFVMAVAYWYSPSIDRFTLGGPEEFGQFGDFVGGVLNPIISIIMISLVYHALRSQHKIEQDNREILNTHKKDVKFSQSLNILDKVQNDKKKLLENHHRVELLKISDADEGITFEGSTAEIIGNLNRYLPKKIYQAEKLEDASFPTLLQSYEASFPDYFDSI